MKKMFNSVFPLLIMFCAQAQEFNTYSLRIDLAQKDFASVEAKLFVSDDTLFMDPSCPNYDFPEGWSSFIKGLSARNELNQPINLEYIGTSRWLMKGRGLEKKIILSYQVDLQYAKIKWAVGNEQAGYYENATFYSVTKPFFIVNGKNVPTEIRFNLPQDWKIATPWQEKNSNTFIAANQASLLRNSLIMGKFRQFTVSQGRFNFVIAIFDNVEKGEYNLINIALQKVLQTYLQMFPNNMKEKYLVTIFHADQDDGESFENSIAFTQKDKISVSNTLNWANQLCHELFHYWNGSAITIASPVQRWFQEGFTEYFANLALVRNNIISTDEFYSKAQYMLGLYNFFKWLHDDQPMDSAGLKRGDNRLGVYNGGWTVAFSWDMMLRTGSGDKQNLDSFMSRMYKKYGSDHQGITPANIITTLNEVTPGDYQQFYDRYIKGKETIPINTYLAAVGLWANYVNFQGELYLLKLKGTKEVERRKRWLGK